MARTEDRKKAIELRLQGKTFTEIKAVLGIGKGTLSPWLKDYPLSPDHLRKVYSNRMKWIESYRNSMAKKRELKEQVVYEEQKDFWLPLTEREFQLAGLFLYWGEGSKTSGYACISNSNPRIVKFAKEWFIRAMKVPQNKIRILLHLYSDMSISSEINYWQDILKLPLENFRKPYIKLSTRAGLSYKSFGHGTCNLIISDLVLKTKVMKSLEAISDHYSSLV